MKRFALALVLAVGTAFAARAQSVPPLYVFTTVDSVMNDTSSLSLTGILQGDATPTTKRFIFYSSATYPPNIYSCEKMALLSMAKPGQYTFTIQDNSSSGHPKCTLARVAP